MLAVGTLLRGYCYGQFGDTYESKRVEAVGVDWVVAREPSSGEVFFASGKDIHQILLEAQATLKSMKTVDEAGGG